MRILVVGDAHVEPKQNLDRFRYVARVADDYSPDAVVLIGDFLSLDSLNDWDRDKRKLMEGRRYQCDVDAGNKALDLMATNRKLTKYFLYGNHEDRLRRYLERNPEFERAVDLDNDLYLGQRGYAVVPYTLSVVLDGVNFTHAPISRHGKAVSGNHAVRSALDLYVRSVVFGHTHRLEHVARKRHGGSLQQSITVGCYFSHNFPYTNNAPSDYWRGLVLLDTNGGTFDVQTLALENLKKWYR